MPIEIGSPLYFMRVYYKDTIREYKGKSEQMWQELFNLYAKVELDKKKGKRDFETMKKVLPPLPDVGEQREIQELEE